MTQLIKPLLLDTCALLWLINGERLAEEARSSIRTAASASALFISPISAWEVAMLSRKRRLALNRDAEDWFDAALKVPGVELAELSWRTLLRSVTLPHEPPNDPIDRILISTARRLGFCLVTRDRQILDYAEAGHLDAIAC